MDKMRERFEKWALTECFDLTSVGGFYSDNETHAAYIAWQAARTVPDGFVMVPVEPTKAMIDAGRWHEYRDEGDCAVSYVEDAAVASVWSYMLSAAPEGKK